VKSATFGEVTVSKHDEDSDDKLLDQLGKSAGGTYCQKWFVDDKGRRRRCTKKKGHWGKHK
jgi:hypothetical protein